MPALATPAATLIFTVTIGLSLLGIYRLPVIVERCLFRPHALLRRRQYHTFVTSGLVHADIGHLVFNMFTFWFFAFPMERHVGTTLFSLLYVGGLVISHLCTWWKHRRDARYASLGASGAIAAVLFAYIVYFPRTTLIIFPLPVPIPAVLFAIGYVAWSYWAAQQARGRINHDAHLCGALSGLAFVGLTDPDAFGQLVRSFL